jgi:hypothetical protein
MHSIFPPQVRLQINFLANYRLSNDKSRYYPQIEYYKDYRKQFNQELHVGFLYSIY